MSSAKDREVDRFAVCGEIPNLPPVVPQAMHVRCDTNHRSQFSVKTNWSFIMSHQITRSVQQLGRQEAQQSGRSGKIAALVGCVAFAAAAFGINGANAETIVELEPVTVSYEGLDIATKSGATILYGRLRSAARRVCGPLDGRELARHARFNTCVATTLARAVADVNLASVTALHRLDTRVANAS